MLNLYLIYNMPLIYKRVQKSDFPSILAALETGECIIALLLRRSEEVKRKPKIILVFLRKSFLCVI